MPNAPRTNKPKRKRAIEKRPSAAKRGYDSKWRKVRITYLERNPLCEACKAFGVTTPALDVDHIIPLSNGGKRLAFSNMQALCRRCHNNKTFSKEKE